MRDDREEAAGRWAKLAEARDYQCENCGERPIYEERELFFEEELCASCHYAIQRMQAW